MALRPQRPRRRRPNPFTRTVSDEVIGLVAGFLLATTAARVLALAAGLEHWTTTWRVIDALTLWFIWPLERVGVGREPTLVGLLRPVDVLSAALLLVLALFLLATRTYRSRA